MCGSPKQWLDPVFSVDSGKLFHSASYGDIRVVQAIAHWVKTDGFNESSLIKDSQRKKESILSLRLHGAIEVWISFYAGPYIPFYLLLRRL